MSRSRRVIFRAARGGKRHRALLATGIVFDGPYALASMHHVQRRPQAVHAHRLGSVLRRARLRSGLGIALTYRNTRTARLMVVPERGGWAMVHARLLGPLALPLSSNNRHRTHLKSPPFSLLTGNDLFYG